MNAVAWALATRFVILYSSVYKFSAQTYQLIILAEQQVQIQIGRLGLYKFQKGYYVYTGSAKQNLIQRVARHLSHPKKFRWHIDYLLAHKFVRIVNVHFKSQSECSLNQECPGEIPIPGFGSSDCKQFCGSHLKFLPCDLAHKTMELF